MALTADGQKQTLLQETPAAFIHLLEMYIPGNVDSPIRIADNLETVNHASNDYLPLSFETNLSDETRDSLPSATLSLDNVDRSMATILGSANPFEPIKCILIIISSLELDEVQTTYTFYLKSTKVVRESITCQISYTDTMNQRFPDSTMNSIDFKAIE